jgi:hypothetical protein
MNLSARADEATLDCDLKDNSNSTTSPASITVGTTDEDNTVSLEIPNVGKGRLKLDDLEYGVRIYFGIIGGEGYNLRIPQDTFDYSMGVVTLGGVTYYCQI